MEPQLVALLARERQTHQPPRLAHHEIDGGGSDFLGGDDEIAFVFAVFVIDQDDHAAGFELVEDLGDGAEGHVGIVEPSGAGEKTAGPGSKRRM